MRLLFNLGLQRTIPHGVSLRAAAEPGEPDPSRHIRSLIAAAIDLKTIFAILSIAGALIGSHVAVSNNMAALKAEHISDNRRFEKQSERITALENSRVTHDEYDRDLHQIFWVLNTQATYQQQLYAYALGKTVPLPAAQLQFQLAPTKEQSK